MKWIKFGTQTLIIVAIFIALWGYTDKGRIICKDIFYPKLAEGINTLFQQPNKYVSPEINQTPYGPLKYFMIEKGNEGFEDIKEFVLQHYYRKNSIDYDIKAVVEFQNFHFGHDPENPDFNLQTIFFVPETKQNKEMKLKSMDFNEYIKTFEKEGKVFYKTDFPQNTFDLIPITTQVKTMERLDNKFSYTLSLFSSGILILIAMISIITLFVER